MADKDRNGPENGEEGRNVILEDLDILEIQKEKVRKHLSLLDLLHPKRNAEILHWQKLFAFARPYVPKIIACFFLAWITAAMVGPKLWLINVGIKPIVAPEEVAAEELESPSPLMKIKDKVWSFFGSEKKKNTPRAESPEGPAGKHGSSAAGAQKKNTGKDSVPPGKKQLSFDPEIAKSKLIVLIVLYLFIVLVEQVLSYFRSVMIRSVGHLIILDIRNALFAKVMSFSLKFHNKNHSGKLMSRITGDIAQFGGFFTNTAVDFITNTTTFVISAGALILMGGGDIVLFASVVFLIFLPVQIIGRQIRKSDRQIRRSVSVIYSHLSEALSGQKVIKAFSTENDEYDKFKTIGKQAYRKTMKSARLRSRTAPVVEILGAFVVAALLWYGGVKVIEKEWSFGDFATIGAALVYLVSTTRRIAKCNNQVAGALASADRVATLLFSDPEISDAPGAVELKEFRDSIRFNNISYEYEPGIPVLKDIDFTAPKGRIIALVGPSGAGKTTLVDLIPRFYDVVGGSITIDGIDIRRFSIHSLRKQIGIVSQETFLFSDTVRMNIGYGNPDATDEMIVAAAKAANAHDFIMEMEHGYDTQIGERGVFLSGGQRQRIAIARALLKNPPILILDEATSSLDSTSEALVQEALFRLMKGRTTFVIAHRLSTVRDADMILVFDEAHIVEKGTHDELMARGGLYARLHDLQTRWPGIDKDDRIKFPGTGSPR